ncbi:MAG: hypothetical protein AAF357_11750, partial [Verrucomicrobiota bacterium]
MSSPSSEPELEIIGAHAMTCDASVREKALREKFPHCKTPEEKRAALKHIDDELGSLVLFEISIRNRNDSFNAGDFGQPGSDQCAYMEHYLNLKGTAVVGRYFDVPPTRTLRLAFFLHFFDPSSP